MSDLKLVQVQEYNHQFSFLNRFDKENKQKKFACGVARCKKVFNTKHGLKEHTGLGCAWRCPEPGCKWKPLKKESLENVVFYAQYSNLYKKPCKFLLLDIAFPCQMSLYKKLNFSRGQRPLFRFNSDK